MNDQDDVGASGGCHMCLAIPGKGRTCVVEAD
jgi:hypothetical protein